MVNLFTSDKKKIKSLGFWATLLLVSTSSNSLSNFFPTSSFSSLNFLAEALGERRRCVQNRINEENITVYEAELTSLPITGSFLSESKVPSSWFSAVESRWKLLKTFNLNEQNTLVSLQKNLAPAKFSISADKKYLLLAQNVQKLFRHSFLAQYTVFDIQAR